MSRSVALGDVIGNQLASHFDLPKNTTEIRIVIKAGSPVIVECVFLAEQIPMGEVVKLLKTYSLIEIHE